MEKQYTGMLMWNPSVKEVSETIDVRFSIYPLSGGTGNAYYTDLLLACAETPVMLNEEGYVWVEEEEVAIGEMSGEGDISEFSSSGGSLTGMPGYEPTQSATIRVPRNRPLSVSYYGDMFTTANKLIAKNGYVSAEEWGIIHIFWDPDTTDDVIEIEARGE